MRSDWAFQVYTLVLGINPLLPGGSPGPETGETISLKSILNKTLILEDFKILFYDMYGGRESVHVLVYTCTHTRTHLWKAEDSFQSSILSFHRGF